MLKFLLYLVCRRIDRLQKSQIRFGVFGASDPRAGACGTLYNLCVDPRLNHEVALTGGVRAEECGDLLSTFFAQKRPGGAAAPTSVAGQSG